jgi:AcrR family transcriptional regulator
VTIAGASPKRRAASLSSSGNTAAAPIPYPLPNMSTGAKGGAPAQERELRAQGRRTMGRLLEAAMLVFEKRGYHAARVDDIVKLAKTSHGTFYLYFANKEDLFRALASDVGEKTLALTAELGEIGPHEDGYLALRAWLARFAELYRDYGPVIRVWTEAEIEAGDVGRMGTELLTGVSAALARQIARSPAAANLDPQIAATAFLAMIERFHYYVLSRQIEFDDDDILDTIATFAHQGLFGGDHLRGSRIH